ncbi:MAG: Lsr2 family DNA-binding protein [Egibacteraceae bacterium]
MAVEPSAAQVRAWARESGLVVSSRGRLGAEIRQAHRERTPLTVAAAVGTAEWRRCATSLAARSR